MNPSFNISLGIQDPLAQVLAQDGHDLLLARGFTDTAATETLFQVVGTPGLYLSDAVLGPLARALYRPDYCPRPHLAPWQHWGDDLDSEAMRQLANACALPVSVAGALMPDAHVGYGLPIGGVLATENAVIPYAVGMDIACRMKLTIYERKANVIPGQRDRLANLLENETRFGMGCEFEKRRHHDVMDENWGITPVTQRLHEKAWKQLGTSGSGNHFVEFGSYTVIDDSLGIPPGEYLALLSHSGSRGSGAQVCETYCKRAMSRRYDLPASMKQLAWLTLDEADGQEYWEAMNLMGRYAEANHEVIHKHITKKVGCRILLSLENHHNFAWKEVHDGREVIVHRKGATPAGPGVLGIIPGSMAAPGYVVRGRGLAASLHSASHGAGRRMGRKEALHSFTWSGVRKHLTKAGVQLLSAGLDECPGAYKDIETVMAAQKDLVDVLGKFQPRIVKMSADGSSGE